MTIHKLTQLLLVGALAVGCQKGSEATSIDTAGVNSSLGSISCDSGSSGLSIAEAKILGADNVVADQKTILSLESNVSCAQAEKAQWSVGNTALGQGGQVQATIRGTGVYYIKVNSEEASALNSDATPVRNKVTVTSTSQNSVRVAVTDSKVMLVGSQVGVEFNTYTFSLVVPTGVTLKTADWNFGQGIPLRHSLTSENKSFTVGTHTFSVVVTDTNDKVTTLQHTITILPISSGIDCTADQLATLEITGPTQVPMSEAFDYALNQPACIQNAISKVSWSFGDGSAVATTSQVEHTYATKGDYQIAVSIWMGSATSPSFVITRDVNVIDVMEQFPGPDPGIPTDPNACVNAGSTRTVDGSTSTKEVACGLNGKRTDTYKDQIVQMCQGSGGSLTWVEQSRTQVKVSEGTCESQSCVVVDQVIAHGQTVTLYTNQNPINSCASVQESRTCTNGVLSGSSGAVYSTCQNGCGDFGSHGTVKTAVVIGSISTPVQCQFQEQGIVDIFNQIADQKCVNGAVVTSDARQGSIKEKGTCPAYSWVATTNYTTCSADCGGQQQQIFACRNGQGVDADPVRCGGATTAPIVERICDGNPEAVRKTTSTSVTEEAGSSSKCPKNQIGVIISERTVTTNVTVACVDHHVQEVSRVAIPTDWTTTSYCRDLVPMRCSKDSLSNREAQGRYDWMVKCQDQVPVIKEFLTNFENVSYNGISLDDSARHLYPTFLDTATKKTWIAPKTSKGSCDVPATAYVAAVCVSSCATPEQEIMAEVESERTLRRVPFIDALTKKLANVGTLQSNSSINSKKLEKTEVDAWVTELLDTTQPVLTFKLKSGGHIRVTPNHPLLNKDGAMQLASTFKVNDSLVQLGGHLDKIVSVESADYYGKVYNLFVKSNDLKKNVVVINNYLSGTAFYQNEGAQNMNRELFRKTLTRGAFDK